MVFSTKLREEKVVSVVKHLLSTYEALDSTPMWANREGVVLNATLWTSCLSVCLFCGRTSVYSSYSWTFGLQSAHTLGYHGGFGSTFKALWESHECISKGRGRVVLFIYTPITRVQGFRLPFICTYFLKTGKMAEGVKELDARPNSLLGIHILVL